MSMSVPAADQNDSDSHIKSFYDFYDPTASSDDYKVTYCKSPENKSCIFCGRSYPEVSFQLKPHLVPELFGRNNILSNHECDICNTAFNFHETQTATFVQPFLSMLGVKTKKGIPVFQSRKKPDQQTSTLRVEGNNRIFNIGTNLSDMVYDYEKKSVRMTFRTRPFIPFSVYKVLLKMGISLMPEKDRALNPHLLDFLKADHPVHNNVQHWTLYRYVMKGKMFGTPSAKLFRAKQVVVDNEEFPEFCLMMNFANVTLQFFLPITEINAANHDPARSLHIEIHPSFVLDDYKRLKEIKTETLDLDQTEKVTLNEVMTAYYDRIDRDTKNDG